MSEKALKFVRKAIDEHAKVGVALDHAKAAGDALIAARDAIGVKGWREWADKNVYPQIPQSSAYLYIRIARNWEEAQKAGSVRAARTVTTKRKNASRQPGQSKIVKAAVDLEQLVKTFAKAPPDSVNDRREVLNRLSHLRTQIDKVLAKLASPVLAEAA